MEIFEIEYLGVVNVSGNVNSVNGQTGDVNLTAGDIPAKAPPAVEPQEEATVQSALDAMAKKIGNGVTLEQLNAARHTTMCVEITDDGFGGYNAHWNGDKATSNIINNHRNADGVVMSYYYDHSSGKTFTYWYSTMESDRMPTFIRTYIDPDDGKVHQVLFSIDNDGKAHLDQRTAAGDAGVQSDWSVSDSGNPAYVKNRICYMDGTPTGDIVPETTAKFVDVGIPGVMMCQDYRPTLVAGQGYGFVLDGQEYIDYAKAYRDESRGYTYVYFGNGSLMQLPVPDTGEPFAIAVGAGIVAKGDAPTHTVHLYNAEITLKKLSPYFLPDELGVALENLDQQIKTKPGVAKEHLAATLNSTKNVATGKASLAVGYYTDAAGRNQFVCGAYNVPDTTDYDSGNFLIVGNGLADNDRKNAFVVSRNGNAWARYSVYIGGDYGEITDGEFLAGLEWNRVIITSSTPGSVKRFAITVDDSGTIKAEEVV